MSHTNANSIPFDQSIFDLASTPPGMRDLELVALKYSMATADVAIALNTELDRRQENSPTVERLHTDYERKSVISRCMASIKAEPIVWLWRDRIPTKLVVLAGNPGLGKSQVSIAIAATVSIGGRWPDMTACEKGSAIFICGEDDAADTIKPRLEAAGADVEKIHIVDGLQDIEGKEQQWLLEEGIGPLRDLCAQIGDVKLIVIDPITAYTGKRDSHNTADVRGLLAPLMALADEYKITVLVISHLNKSAGGDAVTRVTGSGAYVAASRVAFVVGKHPTDDDAQCIATIKSNLSGAKTGIGYKVVSATSADDIPTSCIEWTDCNIEIDADDLLSPKRPEEDLDVNSAKGDAAAFLIDTLKDGPLESTAVYSAADKAGIAERTLKRAKKTLLIRSTKIEGKRGWFMALPERTQDDPNETDDTLGPLKR